MQNIKTIINDADAFLIGAANGFSAAEGFFILRPSAWFEENFAPFIKRYGYHTPIEALSYPYASEAEYWQLWTALMRRIHYDKPVSPVMRALKAVVGTKPAFIVTTNVEDRFVQAGFPEKDVFYLEGRLTHLKNGEKIPDDVVRRADSETNGLPFTRRDLETEQYVGSAAFERKYEDLKRFVKTHQKLVILELGVGAGNQLIRPLLFNAALEDRAAVLFILNQTKSPVPPQLADRTVYLTGDLSASLEKLAALEQN